MNVFRKRKQSTGDDPGEPFVAQEPADGVVEEPAAGPWDESHADDGVPRLDLGALRVPARPGMELRLEVEDPTKRVVAATIGLAGSTVQLQAFAAPRTAGIWDDIRTEIAAQVTKQGGSCDEVTGSFGQELLARLPARTPDGRTAHRPVRFVGIDGPRWFVRGVFNGPAAAQQEAAQDLEQVIRGLVVVRGTEAMAPRDVLPLKLPTQGRPDGDTPGGADAPPSAAPGNTVPPPAG